jgi:hypothetical protein
MIILLIAALLAPRAVIAVLYFFTSYFTGVFDTLLYPLLGFLLAPFTLLWFSVVEKFMGGEWGALAIVGMVVAVLIDFSSVRFYRTSRRRKRSLL